jgi:hypothetical protein
LGYFLYPCEYGTSKPVEVFLSRGWRKRKNNGPNLGHTNPPVYHHILIQTFKNVVEIKMS